MTHSGIRRTANARCKGLKSASKGMIDYGIDLGGIQFVVADRTSQVGGMKMVGAASCGNGIRMNDGGVLLAAEYQKDKRGRDDQQCRPVCYKRL